MPATRRTRLSSRSRLRTEQLEPRNLLAADLLANWRAHDLLARIPDGGTVTAWTDSVGGISAAAAGQPRLLHSGIGGKGTIAFNPADGVDQLRVDRLASPMNGSLDFSVAVVFATDSTNLVGLNSDWFQNTAVVDANSLGFANDWGISLNQAGQVGAGLGFGFSQSPLSLYAAQTGLNDGNWHAALFRRSGTNLSLQVDSGPATQRSDGHANPLSGIDLSIGSQKFETLPFTGQIAEVRVYRGALDATEANRLLTELRTFYNNAIPQAVPDSYTLPEDPIIFIEPASTGVLANDIDPDADPLTAVLVEGTRHGTISLSPDGSFIYDPSQNFFGTDTFQYAAVDSRRSTSTTVTLNVLPAYDPATPVPDAFKGLPSQVLDIPASVGLLANDINPDQAHLQAVLQDEVGAGSLTLRADGSFRYDPEGFAGVTTFSYRIDDGTRVSAAGTVTLTMNTPPTARDDSFEALEDTQLLLSAARGVLANDDDRDGNPLTTTVVEPPSHGTLSMQGNGSLIYVPSANFFGEDFFRYQLTDGMDSSEIATARVEVMPVNDVPVAQPDRFLSLIGQTLEIPAARGILANDTDVESSILTAQLVDLPQHGTVDLHPNGSLVYQPAPGFLGADSFTYRANDGQASSAVTRVDLTVSDTPVIISEFMAANSKLLPTRIRYDVAESYTGEAMTPDWIEIENQNSAPISLEGMHLTDDERLPKKWAFPSGTVIPASGRLIVYASGLNVTDPNLDETKRLHTNFNLSRHGDYLALTFSDGAIISEFAGPYPGQRTDVSYGVHDGATQYFTTPTPGNPNSAGIALAVEDTKFSVDRGFKSEAFTVDITSATPGATIVYTLDGQDPSRTTGTKIVAPAPDQPPVATIEISATTTLRAAAFKDGMLDSNIDTQTYIFVNNVVAQSTLSSTVRNHPEWGPKLAESLLALPTISLVTPGRVSEREIGTSVEMIFPDGSEPGFQIDAGVEHYGGHSLNSPKKNMRLSFKSKYGDGSLKYDLFGATAVDEFEQLLLRTGSHDTFFWTHPNGGQGNYLRNRWAFDRQLEMGQPAPHGRFVHVYINGRYWGMHDLMERPEADFMASYVGGLASDYDVLNAGTPVDGNITAWRAMQQDAVMDNYAELQKYLDVDNYTDYMLLQFYGGNDWDWSTEQNWMSARKREEGAGYMFFAWDSDVILRTTAAANVISRGGPSNLWNVRGGVKQHKEFLLMMADRAQKYFFGDGMFTDARLRADVEQMANTIRLPMIAESARWGGRAYTPDTWESAVKWMVDRFAPLAAGGRAETVIQQLRRAGIYPSIDTPTFTVNGNSSPGGDVGVDDVIRLQATSGSVYYTLDGSDPRLPGGDLNPSAVLATAAGFELVSSSTIKARALRNDEWSTLAEVRFRVNTIPADGNNLRITEIQYHPADPTETEMAAGFGNSDDFEYIELLNISDKVLNLSSIRFAKIDEQGDEQGVAFSFAGSLVTELAPGARVVVVEDVDAFRTRYGAEPLVAGQWDGSLANSRETVTLLATDDVIHQFTYFDDWYPVTDGHGPSLQVANELEVDRTAWVRQEGWRASRQALGSPGTPDTEIPGDANRDGVFNSSDLVAVFVFGEYEDAIAGNSRWEEGDWNGDGDFTTADLVLAFASGKYVVAALPTTWPSIDGTASLFRVARHVGVNHMPGVLDSQRAIDAVWASETLDDPGTASSTRKPVA